MTSKIFYFFQSRFVKTKKYLNKVFHNALLGTKSFIKEREIWKKFGKLCLYLIEVAFTGIIIFYAITHFNWISCGLIAALTVYYIEWFVKLIRKKEE